MKEIEFNKGFGQRVTNNFVKFIKNGGFRDTTNPERAREIMGKNFFGIEEAIKYYKINPTHQQLATLSDVPFSTRVLKRSYSTHVLVAVFPLSILDIRDKVKRSLFYSHDNAWYNNQTFAKEKGEVAWQLVRKIPVDDSTSKNWPEQLSKDDGIPSAQVMVYTIIGHYMATGERLFKHTYIQTLSVNSDGNCICVGDFNLLGLLILYYCVERRSGYFGTASARKQF